MSSRDVSLDILRCIALLGIIIVHCYPSQFIIQLRNFDVPLIVFCSGVAFSLSSSKSNLIIYKDYVWKRFVRLIIPTWLFLFIFYIFYITAVNYLGETVTLSEVVCNFFLYTGWYVWIIRVFFIIALVAPLINRMTKDITSLKLSIAIVVVLILNEFFANYCTATHEEYLVMMLPYFCIFTFGCNIYKFNKHILYAIAIIGMCIFLGFAYTLYEKNAVFVDTNVAKWPPRIYYLSYAVSVTIILWLLRNKLKKILDMLKICSVASFVGSHTIWIYFWHIPFVILLNYISDNWLIKVPIVLLGALCLTYLQINIVKRISSIITSKKIVQYINMIFIG